MDKDPWGALLELAAAQHQAVHRRQARDLRIRDAAFTRRTRREGWGNPQRGVYVLPGVPLTYLTRLSAVLLSIGDHALLTGRTALYLHGITAQVPPRVDVLVEHTRRAPKHTGARIRRSRTVLDTDSTAVDGLACAQPPRAFVDADDLDIGPLRVHLIDARQRGVDLADVVGRAVILPARFPGRTRLLRAAADIDAVGADSAFSDAVHRHLLAEGLTPDADPATVTTPDGRVLHPDITFSDARVCIECDSIGFHADQESVDTDHRKDQAYHGARWRCLRIGWRRYEQDLGGFVQAVRRALDEWPAVVEALAGRDG